ncbi:MAG TPA: winged helix-turn-helix domain-containing protein [Terriglobales bacterium]|nr:winged helix-turn-helix domain-containing protein [Terriglobales bacterium]
MGQDVLQFDDIELDLEQYELRRSGRVIKLERQPMELLILLAERPGRLVSRDDIIARLWGQGTYLDTDQSINSSIRKIRAALKDNPEQPRYVLTVVGKGYRFVATLKVQIAAAPEISPAPDDATASATLEVSPPLVPPKWHNRVPWLLIAMAALLIISGAVWVGYGRRHWNAHVIRSIAVIPLENLSGDPSQEYFADGMTDALITNLAKLRSIRVISRTSVMQYKNARKSLPQIARELDVEAVVEGAVVRSGQNVRITAQLIEAATDRHLWADSYDSDSHDILRLQNQVALAIAEQVQGRLDPQDRVRFSAASVDPEAYDDYVKGRYFWSKFTLDSVNKGFDFFNQAVQKDPSYAPAYVGLAESHINLMFAYNVVSPAEGCEKAESESKKALEIDDANAEAHATLARFKLQCAWDWAAAEKEFRQALELEPGSSEVHHQYAHFLVAMGRIGAAWGESLRTLELDPYGIRANSHQGWHHFYAREYDLAIRDFQRTLTMEPNDSYSRRYLANSYEQKSMYPEAVAELQKTPSGAAWTPVMRAALGYADAMAGNRREAMTIVNELETESKQQFVPALDISLIYLSLGDKDRALEWLERAYRERSSLLIYLKVDPRFDALRSDHRFRDLVQRVGLNT